MSSTCQKLLAACAEGHSHTVRYLLQKPRELDFNPSECKDKSGSSLLHIACQHGHSDIVAFLIGKGFSVNCQDNEGNTPLHVTCYFSALECAKCLLQARCNGTLANIEGQTAQTIPFSLNGGDMLLHVACRRLDLGIVKYLIDEEHYDVNMQNREGDSPLHIACKWRHLNVVQYLLSLDCCEVKLLNSNGDTPLHVACKRGDVEIVKSLIQYGMNEQNQEGHTPLHVACKWRNLEVVKHLTGEMHCDAGLQNKNGDSLLHVACRSRCFSLVQYLVSLEHCNANAQNNRGDTPLHIACKRGDVEIVKSLACEGQSYMNAQNEKGDTPLHAAVTYSKWVKVEVVKCLISEMYWDVNVQNKEGNTPLHIACYHRALPAIKYLLEQRCKIKLVNRYGKTPQTFPLNDDGDTLLHLACQWGEVAIVRYLVVEERCDVNVKNRYGDRPLHIACTLRTTDIVKCLKDEIDDMNVQNKEGNTPLHIACYHMPKTFSVIKYLLEQRCKTNIVNKDGKTSQMIPLNDDCDLLLHLACHWREAETVRYLVSDMHCDMNVQNKEGNTPLHIACYHRALSVIKYLLEQRCDTTVVNRLGKTPQMIPLNDDGDTLLHLACQWGEVDIVRYYISENQCDVNMPNQNSNTPLHLACRWGNLDVVVFLVSEQHCDMNVQNKEGNTPLHIACYHRALSVIKYLLEQRCDTTVVNRLGKTPQMIPLNDDGDTLLHLACQWGEVDIVRYYISENQCDVNMPNQNSNTPLHLACRWGNLDVVVFLVSEQHCDMNVQNKEGNTPLHIACYHRALSVIKYLLEQRCDTTVVNRLGKTPQMIPLNDDGDTLLHLACQWGEVDIVRYYISENQCDVNMPNQNNDTPLHVACRWGNLDIVVFLASEQHCDMNVQNKEGNTPLHVACYHRALSVIKYLLQQRCKTSVMNIDDISPQMIPLNDDGDMLFHVACELWDAEIVRYIAHQEHCELNAQNKKGDLPLMTACKSGNIDIVKYLVSDIHCNVQVQNKEGDTPLHVACRWGSLNIVEYLTMKMHCDVNVQNKEGNTPLHIACSHRALSVIKYLLEQRCITKLMNTDGETPQMMPLNANGDNLLHLACACGEVETVRYLVSEERCGMNVQNMEGNTPLHIACSHRALSVIKYLLEQRCKTNLVNRDGTTPLTVPLNDDGDTLLHAACQWGDLELLKHLVSDKQYKSGMCCDLNAQNNLGNTPLHTACFERCLPFIEYFLKQRCSTKVLNQSSVTPQTIPLTDSSDVLLHVACKWGDVDLVRYLVYKEQCDINVRTMNGDFPLHIACKWGNLAVVKYLVHRFYHHLNIQNKEGNTPLHIACYGRHLAVIMFLLEQRCSTKDMNQNNHTPQAIPINDDGDVLLHLACRLLKISIVKYLVDEEDCDINASNMEGDCPIHVACAKACLSVGTIKYLIDRSVNVKNSAGLFSFLNKAISTMHGTTVAAYLLEHPKCDLTLPDSDGNTPLHLACMAADQDADFLPVARLLLASTSVNPSCVNNAGQTPVELTTNYKLIRDIAYFSECKTKHPIQTYIKIFFIGNPSTGKSTLVEAICREASKLWKLLPNPLRRVRNIQAHTAGIIPITFRSKKFGNTVLYDMAGQYEYYSSHAAVIQSTVLCSPPAFIVFVNLSESEGQILEKLKYWWSFLDNVAARAIAPPHVILLGSHTDVVKSRRENVHEKMESISKVIQHLSSTFHFAGQIALDCRDPVSRKLSNFCSLVDQSCATLREAADLDLHCHILYAFLLEHFGDKVACTVSDVATLIREAGALLPQNTTELVGLVSSLSDRALILLVQDHTSIEDSWIIFQKQALLTEVSGTLFAPENFRQHRDFARSTGVVPVSRIKGEFPQHDPNMVIGLLTNLEFCFKIDDPQTLQRIEDEAVLPEATLDPSDEYYFFPALVSVENPLQVWQPDDIMTYQCGWYYECSQDQFLTTRFLHVLILRLAFSHALALNPNHLLQHSPVICRRCSVWKHGIGWLRDGIETAVEVGLQCQYVTVMMQCRKEKEIKCAQLRSSIICEVVKAKAEFCPAVKMFESMIHPSCISYPFISQENISIHNITDIARAITDKETDIVDQHGLNTIALSKLLAFEPYLYVSPELLNELFAVDNSEKLVPEPFLARFAGHVYSQMPLYEKAINPQPAIDYQDDMSRESLQARKCLVLLKWLLRQFVNPTYENFHKELDKFSIFCGRNPVDVANAKRVAFVQHMERGSLRRNTEGEASESTDCIPEEVPTLRDLVNLPIPSTHWYTVGIQLGIDLSSLNVIQANNAQLPDSVQRCTAIMFQWWLDNDGSPTYRSLVKGLMAAGMTDAVRIIHDRYAATSPASNGTTTIPAATSPASNETTTIPAATSPASNGTTIIPAATSPASNETTTIPAATSPASNGTTTVPEATSLDIPAAT